MKDIIEGIAVIIFYTLIVYEMATPERIRDKYHKFTVFAFIYVCAFMACFVIDFLVFVFTGSHLIL